MTTPNAKQCKLTLAVHDGDRHTTLHLNTEEGAAIHSDGYFYPGELVFFAECAKRLRALGFGETADKKKDGD